MYDSLSTHNIQDKSIDLQSDKKQSKNKINDKKSLRQSAMLLWMTTLLLGGLPAIYVLAKDFPPFVEKQAREALNLFLSAVCYMMILVIVAFYFMRFSDGMSISFLGGLYVVNVFYVVMCIVGFVKSSKLELTKLPLVLRFIK